jgi:hypothetical protein
MKATEMVAHCGAPFVVIAGKRVSTDRKKS